MTVIFFGILVILVILFTIAIYALIKEERSDNKLILEQNERIKKIENELTGKNLELEKTKKQILEIKDELFVSQDALKKENLNKSAVEKKAQELENQLNTQTSELKNELKQVQETLKKESADKLSLEKKLQEAQAQLSKLDKELTSNTQVYEGLKGQYDELERDMEKLQQELANKDTAFKTEQMTHQEIKEKYESLLKTTYGPKVEKEGGTISG